MRGLHVVSIVYRVAEPGDSGIVRVADNQGEFLDVRAVKLINDSIIGRVIVSPIICTGPLCFITTIDVRKSGCQQGM